MGLSPGVRQISQRSPALSAPVAAIVPGGNVKARDRFLAFAFAAAELLIESDARGTICFAAGAFKHWFSLTPEQLIGRSVGSLLSGGDQATLAMCLAMARAKGRVAPVTVRVAGAAGKPMVLSGLCRPDAPELICFTLGRLPMGAGESSDTLGPESLFEAMQAQIAQGAHGTVGLIEIEGLNRGAHGASAREQIASTLAQAAGSGGRTQQLGDGRFGLLMEDGIDVGEVVERVQRRLNALPDAARTNVRGSSINLEAGCGLTPLQVSSAMRYAFQRFADGGIEATRLAGFADGLLGFMDKADARARSTRALIQAGKFKLRFQPIVSLATETIHHYEALLRLTPSEQNPGGGTQEFVTFVEAVGLAEELDLAVMGQALDVMRQAPWASVAINISGASAQSPVFRAKSVAMVSEAVSKHHARPLIELTETVEIVDVKEAVATLAALREAGALTCLDDFGAGAASYRYLRDFQVDFVKIDGSFVRKAETNARTHAMILSIVELANFVGAKVIAEMVETKEQATLMREAGIDFGQGWLFGKAGRLPGVAN
jgi:EAL domain-containing protein (putative c-di-GMP-specific phosphodiesterase class I)